MTATRTKVLCIECAVPLAGGIDTYGGYGESLCFSCYMCGTEKASEIIPSQLSLAAARDLLESADDEEEDAVSETYLLNAHLFPTEDVTPVLTPEQQEEASLFDEVDRYFLGCNEYHSIIHLPDPLWQVAAEWEMTR